MEINQLVASSSTIVTITKLAPGDVYKRVEEGTYVGAAATLKFGVIQSTMNNGDNSAITSLEYSPGFQTVNIEQKVFTGNKPEAIFSATPEEIKVHVAALVESTTRALESKQRELEVAQENVKKVRTLKRQLSRPGALHEPDTIEGSINASITS